MNTASLELCKELYKLSGWNPDIDNETTKIVFQPAYDLGYLLRKLPNTIQLIKGEVYVAYWIHPDTFEHSEIFTTNTPEDACAKLAIELFKQGILK